MNKTIATAAIAGSIILSPVAAMSVTPVRDALLGMAPEEQIVTLADEIDKSRVENEQKLATLEQELASTKQKNAELEEAIESQEVKSETQKTEMEAVAKSVAKQEKCSKMTEQEKYCFTDIRRYDEKELDKLLDSLKTLSDGSKNPNYEQDKKPAIKRFEECKITRQQYLGC